MTTQTPLVEQINERLSGDLRELPVFHSVAVRLHQMLTSLRFRIDDVINLINEDQALASRVLKIANSSFYSGLSKVATVRDAVVRLGAREVAKLAMLASQSERYVSKNDVLNQTMHRLWEHALACATGAQWLAERTGYAGFSSEAFMGGLLHDIGKLAIVKALDELLQRPSSAVVLPELLIVELLGTLHEDVGYRLMHTWCLPEAYCSIAVNHHRSDFDGSDALLSLVRLSNLACRKAGKSVNPDPTFSLYTTPEAHFLGVKEIALAELEIVIEDSGELAT
jgi:HD-like signal output (HDOD) protein